jgi:hypothetical protein
MRCGAHRVVGWCCPYRVLLLAESAVSNEEIDLSLRTVSDELGLSAVPALLFQQVIRDSAVSAPTSRSLYS